MRSLVLFSMLPLFTQLTACTGVETTDTGGHGSTTTTSTDGSDAPACSPALSSTLADFQIIAQDFPDGSGQTIDADCTVTTSTETTRALSCPGSNGDSHAVYVELSDPAPLQNVPQSGVFHFRYAEQFIPFYDSDAWFELRASADPSSALLLAGIRGQQAIPPGSAAAAWFSPLTITVNDPRCSEQSDWACETRRPLDVLVEASEEPSTTLTLHGGEAGALGGLHITVGAAAQHTAIPSATDCMPGDAPLGRLDLKLLVTPSAPLGD